MWSTDEMERKRVNGPMKDTIGEWVNDPDLEAEGKAARREAQVQQKAVEGSRPTGEALEKTSNTISDK